MARNGSSVGRLFGSLSPQNIPPWGLVKLPDPSCQTQLVLLLSYLAPNHAHP